MKHSVLVTKHSYSDLFDVIIEASDKGHTTTREYCDMDELGLHDILYRFRQSIYHRLFELVAVGSSYFETDF